MGVAVSCRTYVRTYVCVCRALARKGNVYLRQEQWGDAIKWFDKSLAEHRDQEVVKKKQKVGPSTLGRDRGGGRGWCWLAGVGGKVCVWDGVWQWW